METYQVILLIILIIFIMMIIFSVLNNNTNNNNTNNSNNNNNNNTNNNNTNNSNSNNNNNNNNNNTNNNNTNNNSNNNNNTNNNLNNNQVLPYIEAHMMMPTDSLVSSGTNSTTDFIDVPIELLNYSKFKITLRYQAVGRSNTKVMLNILGLSKETPQKLSSVLNLIFYNNKNTMIPIKTVQISAGDIFNDFFYGSNGEFSIIYDDDKDPFVISLDNVTLKNQNAKFCVLNLVLTPSEKASFILNKCKVLMKITPYV